MEVRIIRTQFNLRDISIRGRTLRMEPAISTNVVGRGRIEIKSIEAGQCEVGCTKVRGNAIDQESRNVWLVDQGFSLILRGETAKR